MQTQQAEGPPEGGEERGAGDDHQQPTPPRRAHQRGQEIGLQSQPDDRQAKSPGDLRALLEVKIGDRDDGRRPQD